MSADDRTLQTEKTGSKLDRLTTAHESDSTSRRQSFTKTISAVLHEAEKNNPFLGPQSDTYNFPPLDDFLQSGSVHSRQGKGQYYANEQDDQFSGENRMVSLDESDTSNANLSIGARASLNEHLRHVAKFGLDESGCAVQHLLNDSEALEAEQRLWDPLYEIPSDPLDIIWNKLVDDKSDGNKFGNDTLNLHDISVISCSQSIHDARDQSLRFEKIVHNQSTEHEAIEVMTDLSLSDFFNSSRVQVLRTPPKNADRRAPAVTVGRGNDFEPFDSQENSFLSDEFENSTLNNKIRNLISSVALPPSVTNAADKSQLSDDNVNSPSINAPNVDNSFSMWKNLDLSRISADGSDVDITRGAQQSPFDSNPPTYAFGYDLESGPIMPSPLFDNFSPVRELKRNSSDFTRTKNNNETAPTLFTAEYSPLHMKTKIPPSLSSNAQQHFDTNPTMPGNHSSETPPRISLPCSNTAPNDNIFPLAVARNQNESETSNVSSSIGKLLSPISKLAAERASLILKQQIQSNDKNSLISSNNPKLRRTNGTSIEQLIAAQVNTRLAKLEGGKLSEVVTTIFKPNVVSADAIKSPDNSSQRTPDNSFEKDCDTINISPISAHDGLIDNSEHHVAADPYWTTSSSSGNNSKSLKTELRPERGPAFAKHDPVDPDTQQLFLQGVDHRISRTSNHLINNLPPVVMPNDETIQLQESDALSPLHSSSSNKESHQSKSYPNQSSLSSISQELQASQNDSIQYLNSQESNIDSSSFERHTYPMWNNLRRSDESVRSAPATLTWGLSDRRRYRTVVPLRVFMSNFDFDFFPAAHDSFAAKIET